MLLEELIKSDSVLCNARARSKKHCLEILSELLVRSVPHISSDEIVANLIDRERLGCTSLGQGVAFPHCRVSGLDRNIAALIKLSEPVDFDSPDGEPVDIVFGLVVPSDVDADQQADIFSLAELLGEQDLRKQMRAAETSHQLHRVLLDYDTVPAAIDLKAAEGS